ncbi:Lymphocyte antigen 75 [Orchesella cincta]|uniref:Lymphocyte antigen 75 n=1 Tax=Orchesella cincta TaxID=48709 RepID=A0A1D2NBE9_ORCCI|nr:Lymphocyte antigen 75 [Orchesella cincta]
MLFVQIFSLIFLYQFGGAVRPAYEDDPELCPFTNRLTINGLPTEVTDRTPGIKYFRRTNDSRERLPFDQATSICKTYNLEAAEILDQDDYDEVINLVKETGWSFWIAVRGRYNPEFGNYNFDFKLADGQSRLGFQDFGPKAYDSEMTSLFSTFREGCVAVVPNDGHSKGVSWVKAPCVELNDILCQYKKSCYKRVEYMSDPTRPASPLEPLSLSEDAEPGYMISKIQATWPFAKQVCEDAMMDLIWLDGKAEKAEFHKRLDKFMAGKAQYEGKTFWTAGRYSQKQDSDLYDRLYLWQRNNVSYIHGFNAAEKYGRSDDDAFPVQWGMDQEAIHMGRSEPYDEGLSGTEKCVDALFTDDAAKFYTSKCNKAMRYFICKSSVNVQRLLTPDGMPKSSFVDYCVGDQYHKKSEKDCNGEVIFSGPTKPQCTCYNGV